MSATHDVQLSCFFKYSYEGPNIHMKGAQNVHRVQAPQGFDFTFATTSVNFRILSDICFCCSCTSNASFSISSMDGTTFFEHFSFMLAMDAVRPSASFFSPSALVAASLASASALPLLAASASAFDFSASAFALSASALSAVPFASALALSASALALSLSDFASAMALSLSDLALSAASLASIMALSAMALASFLAFSTSPSAPC